MFLTKLEKDKENQLNCSNWNLVDYQNVEKTPVTGEFSFNFCLYRLHSVFRFSDIRIFLDNFCLKFEIYFFH